MSEKRKAVGVEIPDHLYQLLTLAALNLDTTKSQVLRDALIRWMEQNELDIKSLIKKAQFTRQGKWNRRKLQVRGAKQDELFQQFMKEQRLVLEKLSIDVEYVDQILAGIQK